MKNGTIASHAFPSKVSTYKPRRQSSLDFSRVPSPVQKEKLAPAHVQDRQLSRLLAHEKTLFE